MSHARSTVKEITESLLQVVGRSGRVESVTIGKNPNLQVILYDKRAEVLATNKRWWWPIWEDALAAKGLPPLDVANRAASSIWRVEIRANKRHLKEKWEVSTWGHLLEKLPEVLAQALDDMHFTVPSADSNRARWPMHPLWELVRRELSEDRSELASMVDRAEIDALNWAERDNVSTQRKLRR